MTIKPTVAFVGEAMVEMVPSADGTSASLSAAGDVLNSAVYFQRLSKGKATARFVSAIGDDPFSGKIKAMAEAEHIDSSGLRAKPDSSCGLYSISTSETGERSFSYWRSASAARTLFSDPRDFSAIEDCSVVLLTGITLAIISDSARSQLLQRIVELQRSAGLQLAFDSNYRPKLWENHETAKVWTERFWQACDIAFPSIDDEIELFGDPSKEAVLNRFKVYDVSGGALKCGTDGSVLLGRESKIIPAELVERVVDTTAAGDSFNGGYLAELIAGGTAEKCAEAGQKIARHVIQYRGGIVPPF